MKTTQGRSNHAGPPTEASTTMTARRRRGVRLAALPPVRRCRGASVRLAALPLVGWCSFPEKYILSDRPINEPGKPTLNELRKPHTLFSGVGGAASPSGCVSSIKPHSYRLVDSLVAVHVAEPYLLVELLKCIGVDFE